MRIPRVRFTLRRMLFAIAIISAALRIAIEAERVCRFRDQCFLVANAHETHEAANREYTRFFFGHVQDAERVADSVSEYERLLLNLQRPQIPSQEDEMHAWRRAEMFERSTEEVLEARENAFRAACLVSTTRCSRKNTCVRPIGLGPRLSRIRLSPSVRRSGLSHGT